MNKAKQLAPILYIFFEMLWAFYLSWLVSSVIVSGGISKFQLGSSIGSSLQDHSNLHSSLTLLMTYIGVLIWFYVRSRNLYSNRCAYNVYGKLKK